MICGAVRQADVVGKVGLPPYVFSTRIQQECLGVHLLKLPASLHEFSLSVHTSPGPTSQLQSPGYQPSSCLNFLSIVLDVTEEMHSRAGHFDLLLHTVDICACCNDLSEGPRIYSHRRPQHLLSGHQDSVHVHVNDVSLTP